MPGICVLINLPSLFVDAMKGPKFASFEIIIEEEKTKNLLKLLEHSCMKKMFKM